MNFYKYAEMIDQNGGEITPKMIQDIITDHRTLQQQTLDRYERYKQGTTATPILTRTFEGEAAKKINNKLANDYFGEIIDTKVGYLFGQPLTVNYDKEAQGYQSAIDAIERFKKVNNLDDLNAEFCKFASIGGYDVGVVYIDAEGQERVMRIDPWESIVISKTSITEPEYGVNYYTTWDDKGRVDFYSPTKVISFISETGDFHADKLTEIDRKDNIFGYCQMFGIPNNAELQGDGDKVFTLIDAFDRSLSDMNNEIEQFRNAYLVFVGVEPEEEELRAMIKTGALWIPDSDEGQKIEYLIKDLNPAYIDSHLNRLEANITRFAKHVNFTDAAFGSDITGPAMRYKLFALETKSKYFERKHEAAMLYMFKVIGGAWKAKGIPFDFAKLDLQYTRNIPVNLLDEAQTATTLTGVVSKHTALSTLSFVKDVDEEMDRIKKEQEEMINLDDPALQNPNNDPGGNNND